MATVAERGKEVDNAKEGSVRIERDNDRIVYTKDGVIVREDTADGTSINDDITGIPVIRFGIQADGKPALSLFNASGDEIYRVGVQPDGTIHTIAAKPGETIQTIYE